VSCALIVHTILCAAIFWSSWCRIVKTTKTATRRSIRWAFSMASGGSILIGAAPFVNYIPGYGGYQIHWTTLVLLAGFAAVQLATSYHWRNGVPESFHMRRGETV
jgi:hypothetical protein